MRTKWIIFLFKFKRLWSVKIEQQKLSRMPIKLWEIFNKSYNFHSVQTYYTTISGACKRLFIKEKEAGHEYVYCLFLSLWMQVLKHDRHFQLHLNSENNETVQNISIVGKGRVIPIICPVLVSILNRFSCNKFRLESKMLLSQDRNTNEM